MHNRYWGLLLLLPGMLAVAELAWANALADGDDVAALRRQWNLFSSFSPTRQQRIRELDAQLHTLPEEKERHYRKVMENYLVWLDRLPEADRRRLSEPGMVVEERLREIRQIRLREWVASLPESYRKRWEEVKNNVDERSKLYEAWKAEQEAREEEWQLAQRHLGEAGQQNLARLFENPEVRENLEPYLRNLAKFVTPLERQLLEGARAGLNNGALFEAGRAIFAISERNPLLPAPDNAPRTYEALPAAVRAVLPDPKDKDKASKAFREATVKHSGRWPEYARAVQQYLGDHKLKSPQPLGPCRLSEMPDAVKQFAERKLIPELGRTDRGKRELKQLQDLEGSWPEYPDKFMELCRGYRWTVPGWTLPAYDLWKANFAITPKARQKP